MKSPRTIDPRRHALLIGGTSVIAHAIARSYAAGGWAITFAGRNEAELAAAASDIGIRYDALTLTLPFDAIDPSSVDAAADALMAAGALPSDLVFILGLSDGADRATYDSARADQILTSNYSAIVRFLSRLLPSIEAGPGHRIVLVSSVAGDRGRKTNFVYGAAKAALNTYAQGLRALLLPSGTTVLTVKLGYVDTRLAYGKTPVVLTASPDYVANSIHRSINSKAMVVYVPWIWRVIMAMLRSLPESIFIRLPLP